MDLRPNAVIKVGETYDLAVPDGINEFLVKLGGLNPHGEPNYRCVWGWTRLRLVHLAWNEWIQPPTQFDPKGVLKKRHVEARWVPKYFPANRFYFEVWQPAEKYGSPEAWEEQFTMLQDGERTRPLGEYPHRGDYEMLGRIAKKTCRCVADCLHPRVFVYPTLAEAEWLVRANWAARDRSLAKIRSDNRALIEAEERQRDAVMDELPSPRLSLIQPTVSLAGLDVPQRSAA